MPAVGVPPLIGTTTQPEPLRKAGFSSCANLVSPLSDLSLAGLAPQRAVA